MTRVIILLVMMFFASCNNREATYSSDYSNYLDLTSPLSLNIENSVSSQSYFNIGQAKINSRNDIILFDQFSSKYFHFDQNGIYKNSFGNRGSGPYEYSMVTATFFSDSGSFHIYDMASSKIINYLPNGEFSEFIIEESLIDFVVNHSGDVLIYHLTSGKDHVLTLYNQNGEVVRESFFPEDERLKIFLARFRDGNLSYSTEENFYYFLYPEKLEIYVLNHELEITDRIPINSSFFDYDAAMPFPSNLNPFEMNQSHWEYWTSFHHPSKIFLIGSDFFLLQNYEMMDANTWQLYYNLYDKSGSAIFEGFTVPDSLQIIGSDGNYIHMIDSDQDYLNPDNSAVIHRFQISKN